MRGFQLAVLAAVVLAGCGGAPHPKASPAHAAPRTVWLCRPGLLPDPCTASLEASIVARNDAVVAEQAAPARHPEVDCFYVYPTVSAQRGVNATLVAGFREREVAVAQASRFSQACRVYAPVYRQLTLRALAHPAQVTPADALLAYDSVRRAFDDYLAHDNHGRGIVFIGHSQGAAILIRLLERKVDPSPSLRRRLVSALLLGGNATVGPGGDFRHIPPCRSRQQTGCVVAYSSFVHTPPPNSAVGRPTSDLGLRLLAPTAPRRGVRVLCVNPASPAGGSGLLEPMLPTLALGFLGGPAPPVTTPWVAFPGEYTARCRTTSNATWLQISPAGGPDRRPHLTTIRDPAFGLHVLDVNIALGNLVRLVQDQVAAYRRR